VTEGWGGYFDSEDEIEPRTPPMTTEADKRFWLVLQERGCVPRRKGPWPLTETAARLREFIAANPTAYIYVLMLDYRGEPQIQWGPECLQMLDGRSMSVGRKHNERIASMEAARPPVGEEVVEFIEEIARTAYRRGWEEAVETIIEDTPRGRKPPEPPHKDCMNEGSANCLGDLRPLLAMQSNG
jgi:hypothetical protein